MDGGTVGASGLGEYRSCGWLPIASSEHAQRYCCLANASARGYCPCACHDTSRTLTMTYISCDGGGFETTGGGFSPRGLLELLRGHHVVFGGDSTSRQRMNAFKCMVERAGFPALDSAGRLIERQRDTKLPHAFASRFGQLRATWGVAEYALTVGQTSSHWIGLEAVDAWRHTSDQLDLDSPLDLSDKAYSRALSSAATFGELAVQSVVRGVAVLLLLNPGGLHYHKAASCGFNQHHDRTCAGRPADYQRRLALLAAELHAIGSELPSVTPVLVQSVAQHFSTGSDGRGSFDALPESHKLWLLRTTADDREGGAGSTVHGPRSMAADREGAADVIEGGAQRSDRQGQSSMAGGPSRRPASRCQPLRSVEELPFQARLEESTAANYSLAFMPLWRIRAPRFDAHRWPDCTHSSFEGGVFDGEFASLYALLLDRRAHARHRRPSPLPADGEVAISVQSLRRLHECATVCTRRWRGRLPLACERWSQAGGLTKRAVQAFAADATLTCAHVGDAPQPHRPRQTPQPQW